ASIPTRSSSNVLLLVRCYLLLFFFFNDPATTEIYTLSLHDALPISAGSAGFRRDGADGRGQESVAAADADHDGRADRHAQSAVRSEEHTSELQSRSDLVCRLLLEKKK